MEEMSGLGWCLVGAFLGHTSDEPNQPNHFSNILRWWPDWKECLTGFNLDLPKISIKSVAK